MTNKKLKMAAMSVALTACVAASPLAANADAPEAAPGEPKTEPVAEETETKKEENTAEPQVNQEAKNAQETLKDAEVKYNKDNPTTNPDGSQKLDGVIVTNPEGGGETGGETGSETGGETNPNPNPDSGETGSGETGSGETGSGETGSGETGSGETGSGETGSGETGSGETGGETGNETGSGETDPEQKKPEEVVIGTAEKTEKSETTVETNPKPGAKPIEDTTTPPTVVKNPDGSSTITQSTVTHGTEITTTTGSGTATGNLNEKEEEVKEIDLDKELGENPDISWDIKQGDKAVEGKDYTVQEVKNDGNKQTLVLRKEDTKTAEMTAEDIAKLVDAEKPTVNPDGTYTLTRTETVLDAEGNPQTRTTYITIRDNKVTTKTTTELTITRKKEKQEGQADIPTDVVLPEVELSNGESLPYTKLDEMLQEKGGKDASGVKDGTYTYTETAEDGTVREYTIKIDTTSTDQLTNAEIVAKLNNDRYSVEGGDIYYRADNGERVKLTVDQNTALRRNLSIDVSVTETKKGTTEAPDKETAENEAKMNAANDAVKNALMQMGLNETEALEALNVGTLNTADHTFTATYKGKNYTLNYTDPTTSEKVTDLPNEPGKTDIKEHTVTGTAYVTSGTVSWTDESKSDNGWYAANSGDSWTVPKGAKLVDTQQDGSKTIKTYQVTSEDGKTVTTYEVTEEEEDVPLDDAEKNALAERLAWEQLEKNTKMTRAELEAAGYRISDPVFTGSTKKISWTVAQTQVTTEKNEETVSDIIYVDGSKKWNIDETAGTITVDENSYTITQKNPDGSYTCDVIDADNHKTTYTFTEKNSETSLTEPQVRELLVDKLQSDFPGITAEDIQLSDDGKTASYTKDGKTVTIDYSKLSKELDVMTEEHHSSSTVATIKKDEHYDENFRKACEELLEEIKATRLEDGQTLWIGDTQITESTELTEDLIKYFSKAVSPEDMSKDELIKALQAQAAEAKKTDVKVNEGKTDKYGRSYEETLKNYYSGVGRPYYVKQDGSVQELDYDWLAGKYYYWDSTIRQPIYPNPEDIKHADYIRHLDLASGSQLELLPDEQGRVKTTDCVLIRNGLKLEWNYDADKLVNNGNTNTKVNLDQNISYDREKGNDTGHYEYDRGDPNKNPSKSAFYKLTGTVAYDAVTDGNGNVIRYADDESGKIAAVNAYLDAVDRKNENYYSLSEAERNRILNTYIVHLGHTRNNKTGPVGYQVYKKTSQLEAYGYMTRDANTCVNQTYYRQYDSFEYFGGYDLMISNLTQVREGMVVGQTESNIQTITARWSIRSSERKADKWLQLNKKTTETTANPNYGSGESRTTNGSFSYDYTQDHTETLDGTTQGTGEGSYKSFTNLIRNIFNGDGTGTVEGGFIKYVYHTEKNKDGTPVPFEAEKMVVTTKQDAEVHYTFTSQESRDVWIKGYTQTVVPPVNPGPDTPELPPVEDAKPAPAPAPAPEAPVLPVVQDARPDPAPAPAPAPAPETPVLPAVQDAKLIQTGTSGWLADLMLGAGIVLSAAGYWMERKRKAMFYKSQH